MKLFDIGFGNAINADRIVAVVGADTAPARRFVSAAKERNLLIDGTCGKKTSRLYVMDSGHVVLSAKRLNLGVSEESDDDNVADDEDVDDLLDRR